LRQAVAAQRGRHQAGDLDAEIGHGPGKIAARHALEDVAEPLLGEVSGQEEDRLRHGNRAVTARSSSARDATISVCSNSRRRSTLSRLMRRGKPLRMPPGGLVARSGAVSQAKTMLWSRHLPSRGKT